MTLTVKDNIGSDVPLSTFVDGATEHNPRHSIVTAEGAGATIGTTTDAAVITNVNGSLSGKIRGLIALFLDAIGTAADAAVLTGVAGSISGKMRGLVSHVDTIDTQTNNIAGTTSVISGDVTTIRTTTGSTLDSAVITNANGTLSGKLRGVIALFLDGIGGQADTIATAGAAATLNAKARLLTDTTGAQADTAVVNNSAGSLSGKLRGVVALLASAIDFTNGFMKTQIIPYISGGLTNYHRVSSGGPDVGNIKASAGQVYGWNIFNNAAYPVYVKFHNTSGTPTAGSAVVHTIGVAAGGGNNWSTDIGMAFTSGIGISIVKDITDAGATAVVASDCVVDVKYK